MARIYNLPEEVIALIGTHLDINNLRVAILTCRLLHNALYPLLWRQLSLPPTRSQLLPAKVEENAHLVRCLVFRFPLAEEFYSIHYRNVYDMSINYYTTRSSHSPRLQTPAEQDKLHCLLISSNPQIRDLALLGDIVSPSKVLWDTIASSLQNPRRMVFRSLRYFPNNTLETFWRTCSLFEELDLKIRGSVYHNVLKTLSFPRLKRLALQLMGPYDDLDSGSQDYINWLESLPQLEDLDWQGPLGVIISSSHFISALRRNPWPRLESVTLRCLFGPDNEWANLIQLLPPLKKVRVGSRLIGEQSFARLQENHFKSLRSLDVQGCPLFSSRMVLAVLTECVYLEEFLGSYLLSSDLKNGDSASQDWACVGLKQLKLFIAAEPDDPESSELAFKQLSRLHHLQQLYLDEGLVSLVSEELREELIGKGALQLRLDAGLGHLSALKRLTIISADTQKSMRVEDVKWILENFTSLEEIMGVLSLDTAIQLELERILRDSNVIYDPLWFGLFD
ncbi:hypothetical protein EC991_000644 [Linnemannia zychae]|nr:hypothetical protein EC991_000644 [Linnemannia zychae]